MGRGMSRWGGIFEWFRVVLLLTFLKIMFLSKLKISYCYNILLSLPIISFIPILYRLV